MMKNWMMFFVLGLSLATQASVKIGNGGGGVINKDGTVSLLDLVEAGTDKNPFISSKNSFFVRQVQKNLNSTDFPVNLISKKVSEIYAKDQLLALAILNSLQIFSWTFTDYNLKMTEDFQPIVEIPQSRLVQIANRRFGQITISRPIWNKMSLSNRAALVIHESLYSLLDGPSDNNRLAMSIYVRGLVGVFFSPYFETSHRDIFKDLGSYLPTAYSFSGRARPSEIVTGTYFASPFPVDLRSVESVVIAPYLVLNDQGVALKTSANGRFLAADVAAQICGLFKEDTTELKVSHYSFMTDINRVFGTASWVIKSQELDLMKEMNLSSECTEGSKNLTTQLKSFLKMP